MKKIIFILILLITNILLVGCSEKNEEIIIKSPQEIKEVEKIEKNNTIVCENPYIEFKNECCIDENKNSICDETDTINNLKKEYDTIIKEVDPQSNIIKVIVTNTSDGTIDEQDEIKIYMKLKEENKPQLIEELLIKFNIIAGGKTLFANKNLGEEVYKIRYISNNGKPTKEDYLSAEDLVEIKFKTENSIGKSEYVYIKIVSSSGLFIPIHITTPIEFNNNTTQIYP